MACNSRELPVFTLWKNPQSEADGYVTGLEPGTDFPNHKTFERKQGRVIVLPPGGSHATRIDFAVHASAAEVRAVENRIAAIQNQVTPAVHSRPVAKYSPVE